MAKGFAIDHSMTDHGGIIRATQMSASQMGSLFLVADDGHFCPKCKCWSKIIKSHDHIIFDGKAVAYVGDQLTCGAKILPKQDHVVGDSGSPYYSANRNNVMKNSFIDTLAYGHRFQLTDEATNEPLANICYEIIKNNEFFHGTTDKEGYTEIISSDQADEIQINIIYEEHTHEF
ncbi:MULTISPECIES: PAAR domain-containing protein [Acinetobacter]|uniref:PAAR domain-containing protein n=1 Tax=Acinetobacter TaxID=469 RepID=UPI000CFF702B|nr:PAAR domain-containing protein [Acinetobacter sp. MYb10]QLD61867.1 PAAR domain-containing protein [Acinetobacter sp. MYb10]